MNVKTTTRAGRPIMASIGPVGGGAGGGPAAMAPRAPAPTRSFLKNTPVEINEAEVPIRIHRYGLVPDTGGAGRWRGGTALEMEFQVFAPQSMVTARNRDRSVISAWGLVGGQAGGHARASPATRPAPDTVELGSTDIVLCEPGDTLLIQGPGGGGYGDPLRAPGGRRADRHRRGFVSADARRDRLWRRVRRSGAVDERATARAARRAVAASGSTRSSAMVPAGSRIEAVWTPAALRGADPHPARRPDHRGATSSSTACSPRWRARWPGRMAARRT